MSRHFFGNDSITFQSGWDPPLRQFYFNVTDSDDELLYYYPENEYFGDPSPDISPNIAGFLKAYQNQFSECFTERPDDELEKAMEAIQATCQRFNVEMPSDLKEKLIKDRAEWESRHASKP